MVKLTMSIIQSKITWHAKEQKNNEKKINDLKLTQN